MRMLVRAYLFLVPVPIALVHLLWNVRANASGDAVKNSDSGKPPTIISGIARRRMEDICKKTTEIIVVDNCVINDQHSMIFLLS